MAYSISRTNKFERDIKRCKKRGKNMDKLKKIILILIDGKPLPTKNRNHQLIGNYVGRYECHIEPDWLLIYKLDLENNQIIFERTGSHSDLFKK